MVFIIRLCTSVSSFCSQAFHCDDVTLCLALRTQFSSVFNMIIYFPQKIIILMSLDYTACQNYMQIDIFALTLTVFNTNSQNLARYMAILTHAQI